MRFYFPDSQDQIDPSFDFETEERSPFRIRQRDDVYAHEILEPVPYQGMLISKPIVDGGPERSAGRYSAQQRRRLYREGVRDFFRLDDATGERIGTMGDCGAFTYVRDEVPPYTVDEVIDFYEGIGLDAGLALDHIIFAFELEASLSDDMLPPEWSARRELTIALAEEFLTRHGKRDCGFEPVGVAQGWSPASYAVSVRELQTIGYERIALGGLVAQKSHEILAVLEAVATVRDPAARLHLLGVTRCEHIPDFAALGVVSFDSTSPFRQAFKDDRDNYYTHTGNFLALRIPQVDANAKLQRRVRAGDVEGRQARRLEQAALAAVRACDRGEIDPEEAANALHAYEEVHDPGKDRTAVYRAVLAAAPWQECDCGICRSAGVEVIIFRGTERNKRRGFHNLHVFGERLARLAGRNQELLTTGAQ